MRDVEVKALVITMHYSLAQAQLELPGETLRVVHTDASADTLPDTLSELKSEKVRETLSQGACVMPWEFYGESKPTT